MYSRLDREKTCPKLAPNLGGFNNTRGKHKGDRNPQLIINYLNNAKQK